MIIYVAKRESESNWKVFEETAPSFLFFCNQERLASTTKSQEAVKHSLIVSGIPQSIANSSKFSFVLL